MSLVSDLSDLSDVKYDVLVFSLLRELLLYTKTFPDFVQESTKCVLFGPTTINAVKNNDLIPDIEVPNKKFPSMSMQVLDDYITA